MDYILERLKEKSTWIGIVTTLSALGVTMSPELSAAIIATGVGIVGIIAAITADK